MTTQPTEKRLVRIASLPGDGIGQELMGQALPLFADVATARGHQFEVHPGLVGWDAYDVYGDVMPEQTWAICRECDAILFGAVGLPKRDKTLPPELRPERRALLPLRREFGLGCNIRPVRVRANLTEISPLKERLIAGGVDLTFFRELLGGEYFGSRTQDPAGQWAQDTCRYTFEQIALVARQAFIMAQTKRWKVTSIDKANITGATGTYWRQVVQAIHDAEFSDVELEHLYVDAFNLYMITRPKDFQIVLAPNLMGDILSDGGAGIAGSLGLLPSASLNPETGYGMYEPASGSAPDIAGQGIANPIAMFLSVALMLRYTFKDEVAAAAIEAAVDQVLLDGYRTKDIANGGEFVGTTEMAIAIRQRIKL